LYQSHGHCGDICRADNFAFAILQSDKCWCSNYAPDDSVTVDQGECDTKCPGYDEFCGGKNAFGYLYLNKKPSGTLGAGTSVSRLSRLARGNRCLILPRVLPPTVNCRRLLSSLSEAKQEWPAWIHPRIPRPPPLTLSRRSWTLRRIRPHSLLLALLLLLLLLGRLLQYLYGYLFIINIAHDPVWEMEKGRVKGLGACGL
jgi:hypothetical protein